MILGAATFGTSSSTCGSVVGRVAVTFRRSRPGGGGYPITQNPGRNSPALLNRDYREKALSKRITHVSATATARGVVAYAHVGLLRGRGAIAPPVAAPFTQSAVARASTVFADVRMGAVERKSAIARSVGRRRMSDDEWFLLGLTAGMRDGD